uniref:C-type lectin domain-containing protein n=1 Tax=Scylla olivacea TaxID=85551 RepID=A0A0P4W9K5_SCYOL
MARYCYPVEVICQVSISSMIMLSVLLVLIPAFTGYQFWNYTRCSELCQYRRGLILDQCCYVPVFFKMTWAEARRYCKGMGGPTADLACPLSNYALRYELDRLDLPFGHRMWVGISTSMYCVTRFVTGMKVSCLHHMYRPDKGKNCSYTLKTNDTYFPYSYQSTSCNEKNHFVCEMPIG